LKDIIMRSFLVTGGAGFIGSNIAAALSRHYPDDRVIVCDYLGSEDKWKNIAGFPPDEVISPNELFFWLESNLQQLDAIIHMGALSSTTQTNADQALEVNVSLSKILRNWCIINDKRFIYASSAAVYGGGEHGFEDDISLGYMRQLHPLNTYAWSKYTFDYSVARSLHLGEKQPAQWAGLRFFNVYGQNEYHKGDQRSVLANIFPHVRAGRPVHLFKSYHPDYADGGQLRDFVSVDDCVSVVLWLIANKQVSGLFNVGTGKARSFAEMALALFDAMGKKPHIVYEDMPEAIKPRYQYYTQANISRLVAAGYTKPFFTLEEGVRRYALEYLNKPNPYLH
jgi:ADP-L-glycero-D-manno-heptose 6-epimerase